MCDEDLLVRLEANMSDRMGLVNSEGRIAWGLDSGSLRDWPRLALFICAAWNPIACWLWGHRYLCRRAPGELPVCADCSRRIRRFNEKHVTNEW